MSDYYVCKRNTFGETAIACKESSVDSMWPKIIDILNKENMDNVLVQSDKIRERGMMIPVIVGDDKKINKKMIFGGLTPQGKKFFYDFSEEEPKIVFCSDIKNIAFLLGTLGKEAVFIPCPKRGDKSNNMGILLDQMNDNDVRDKGFVHIKKI